MTKENTQNDESERGMKTTTKETTTTATNTLSEFTVSGRTRVEERDVVGGEGLDLGGDEVALLEDGAHVERVLLGAAALHAAREVHGRERERGDAARADLDAPALRRRDLDDAADDDVADLGEVAAAHRPRAHELVHALDRAAHARREHRRARAVPRLRHVRVVPAQKARLRRNRLARHHKVQRRRRRVQLPRPFQALPVPIVPTSSVVSMNHFHLCFTLPSLIFLSVFLTPSILQKNNKKDEKKRKGKECPKKTSKEKRYKEH